MYALGKKIAPKLAQLAWNENKKVKAIRSMIITRHVHVSLLTASFPWNHLVLARKEYTFPFFLLIQDDRGNTTGCACSGLKATNANSTQSRLPRNSNKLHILHSGSSSEGQSAPTTAIVVAYLA